MGQLTMRVIPIGQITSDLSVFNELDNRMNFIFEITNNSSMNNRVILSLVAFFIACSTWTVQAQKNKEVNMKTSKILVAYFSVTGTTENVAKNIAEITNGELYKIVPSKSYTNADLDWNNKNHAVLWK